MEYAGKQVRSLDDLQILMMDLSSAMVDSLTSKIPAVSYNPNLSLEENRKNRVRTEFLATGKGFLDIAKRLQESESFDISDLNAVRAYESIGRILTSSAERLLQERSKEGIDNVRERTLDTVMELIDDFTSQYRQDNGMYPRKMHVERTRNQRI